MTKRIDNYARFFLVIERQLRDPKDLSLDKLFELFEAEGLRRGFVPVTFLIQTFDLEWAPSRLEYLTEKRRIHQLMNK